MSFGTTRRLRSEASLSSVSAESSGDAGNRLPDQAINPIGRNIAALFPAPNRPGSSGNFVGDKERVDINGAPAGTYVLRVINFASTTPSYTLTEELFDSVTRHTAGHLESYTLTWEKNGTVLQRRQFFIRRGETKWVDFSKCRQAW